MTKFPHLLAAVEAREKHLEVAEGRDQWAIGAAVIRDCYPDGFSPATRVVGGHDGSAELRKLASKELARLGYKEYTPQYLRDMADTANAFPASRRVPELSFSIHRMAKNPDILDWIIEKVGVKDMTARDTQTWVVRWNELRAEKHKKQVAEVKKKKAKATTLAEKRAAAEELEKLGTPMPKGRDMPAPSKEDESALVLMAEIFEIDATAKDMTKTLRKNFVALRKLGDSIDPSFIDALVEHHQQVAEAATQIADLLGKNKRGRFAVVKGGLS